jgi:hypothetical protein
MLSDANVPLVFVILKLCSREPVTEEFVTLTVPSRFVKSIPCSPLALPLFEMFTALRAKPFTVVPFMPSSPPPVMFMRVRLTLEVLVNWMPAPVEL